MDVVLCWHMHQPDYRLNGRYLKPWTWLHAIKDYTDMAAHLEKVPGARAVVNFSPVLIEQLQDYPRRVRACLDGGGRIGDFVLDALASPNPGQAPELLSQLLRVNEKRMKDRFPRYAELFAQATSALHRGRPMADGDGVDLLVWYVLAWFGESLRPHPVAQELVERGRYFSVADRRKLLAFVADVLDAILPRYRALAEAGVVELSITPFAHPILPLLLDFHSTREAMPHASLPEAQYPDGEDRCDWHLRESRRAFLDAFGAEPVGCWPSEGAVSEATLGILSRHHFRWTASGSQVLRNSLRDPDELGEGLAHLVPWRLEDRESPTCFFRDDSLSDLIGFEYSKWEAAEAADDFIGRLEHQRREALAAGIESPVLAIIMDGENAWEYFPENGWAFLSGLYSALVAHPDLHLTTFAAVLERTEARPLPGLCAGSWVHGNFSTWIGEPAKNRAWSLLSQARHAVDSSELSQDPGVLRQLAICEASDWMWWLGDGMTLEDAPVFDALFRQQLAELYRMIGSSPPADLRRPVSEHPATKTSADDVVGAMRRASPTP